MGAAYSLIFLRFALQGMAGRHLQYGLTAVWEGLRTLKTFHFRTLRLLAIQRLSNSKADVVFQVVDLLSA